MDILLTIVGVLLGAILAFILALLVLPTLVSADGVFHEDRIDAWADARWAWGAVAAHLHVPEGVVVRIFGWRVYQGVPRRSKTEEPEPEEDEEPTRKRRRPSARFMMRVARRAVRSLRFKGSIRGTVGSGDPARTAWWAAALMGSRRLMPAVDTRDLHLDWVEARLDVDGHVQGLIWPIEIAWIVASEWWRSR